MKTPRILCLYLFMSVLCMGFCACGNDDEEELTENPLPWSFFEIEKVGYQISSEAQAFDVNVRTNITGVSPAVLDFGKDVSWISIVLAKQEKENLTYKVSVKENNDSDERTGNIVFKYESGQLISGSNTIVIIQEGAKP